MQEATEDEVMLEASPDGRLLVLARVDLAHDAILIDADTGRVRHTLLHDGMTSWARSATTAVGCSPAPSGRSASRCGTRARAAGSPSSTWWRVTPVPWTGWVALLEGPPVSPAFLLNGNVLIVPWGREPAVYVWDPSAKRAVEFACRAVGRDITQAEWAEHFPGQAFRSVCPQR